MSMKDRIAARLGEELQPTHLEISDDSHKHAGHSGARAGGETHYSIDIVAAAFQGKSRVARHRLVYALLEAEIAAGVHALALKTHAPGET